MLRPNHRVALAAASAALLTWAAVPATAATEPVPGGPMPPPQSQENLQGLRSYEQLWSTLRQIDQHAKGTFDLAPAPRRSNLGREIPVVTIGDGPIDVMFIAQQHGNEHVVSEAMVELVRDLSGNSTSDRAIRDALTVTVVPRVNVDGFDGDVTASIGSPPWRYNYDPSCTVAPCDPFYFVGTGYDINRYHSPNPDNPEDHPYIAGDDNLNPVPEAIAMRELWDERQPQVVVDFHHQGSYVDEDGRMITGSLLWPNAVATAEQLGIADEFADTVLRSQRAVSVMVDAVQGKGYANLTRYPGTTTPGIARNAYGLLGSASVLFEMRGGIDQRANGYITRTAYEAGKALLEAAADGSLTGYPTTTADELPERGPSVPNPRNGE